MMNKKPGKFCRIQLIFEVMAAALLLKAIVQRSEVNTREKLLEIEYRLAELAGKVENSQHERPNQQNHQ